MTTATTPLCVRLSEEQRGRRDAFRRFVGEHVVPHADAWDRAGEMPRAPIEALAAAGYLGTPLAAERGGAGFDAVLYALLTEEVNNRRF